LRFLLIVFLLCVLPVIAGGRSGTLVSEIHDQAESPEGPVRDLQATFYYELSSPGVGESFAVGTPYLDEPSNTEGFKKAYDLFLHSFGLIPNHAPRTGHTDTFQQSMDLLKREGPGLSSKEKILLLSMIGSELAYGYDYSLPDSGVSHEQLFQNAHQNGSRGGVCTDIAAYLNEVQAALGFDQAGMHDMVVPFGGGTIGHALAQFRDPKSGEYYVQNYSVILNTHRNSLTEAIDVSEHVFGLMSGVTHIEAIPGHVHQYIPYTSRWVARILKGEADERTVNNIAYVKVGPLEQSLILQTATDEGLRGFVVHASRSEPDGRYQVDALGVAGTFTGRVDFSSSIPREIGVQGRGRAGVVYLSVPNTLNEETGEMRTNSHVNPFILADIEGYARLGGAKFSVTGEFEGTGAGNGIDEGKFYINRIWHQFGVGADFLFGEHSPFRFGFRRFLDVVPKSIVGNQYKLQTTKDRIHAVWDSRNGKNKAYLVIGQEVYFFEGAEKMSAVGLRNFIRGAVPLGKLGELYILTDASTVTANRSADPFFSSDRYVSLSQGWVKSITRNLEVGADLRWTNLANPYFEFNRAPGTPNAPKKASGYSGDFWLRFSL
jgi:hypothetical protein